MTVPNPGAFPVPPQQPQPSAANPARVAPPPRKPALTREAAHRARLAGGVGGGVAWLGLGIAQACAVLLLLAAGVAALLRGILSLRGGKDPRSEILADVLPWLGSPSAIALMVGIPVGLIITLLGLWLSTRLLRRPGIARPVGVTWAAFGISLVAASVLGSIGSLGLSPFTGALPGNLGFDLGDGPVTPDTTDVDVGALAAWADPDRLLAVIWPFVAIGSLASIIVPIALSIFVWWWMAHAMRPAAEATETA